MLVKHLVLLASAFASTAFAVGKINVQNKCSQSLWYVSVGNDAGDYQELKPSDDYSEQYRIKNGSKGGISIKVKKLKDAPDTNGLAQLEYTLSPGQKKVYYDYSLVNGQPNPFADDGVTFTPSETSCPTVQCPSNQKNCSAAYNKPDDDHATHACVDSASIQVVFCPDGGGGDPSVSAGGDTSATSELSAVATGTGNADNSRSMTVSPSPV